MRRDGDLLLTHVGKARTRVLLCAPFVKAGVLKALLNAVRDGVEVRVVTRWHAEEVAAGVSDLEVFDLLQGCPGASLGLLDNLHAKLYLADHRCLAGSANLTATALGWCDRPNVEVLTEVPLSDTSVSKCLQQLGFAREATEQERDKIAAAAASLSREPLPIGAPNNERETGPWAPRLAAPERLYVAYTRSARDRLTASTLESADQDLRALDIPPGLDESGFKAAVATAFSAMPAMGAILQAAENDLTDEEAIRILEAQGLQSDMSFDVQWRTTRDWMTYFLAADFEIAPQTFVTRRRPGSTR